MEFRASWGHIEHTIKNDTKDILSEHSCLSGEVKTGCSLQEIREATKKSLHALNRMPSSNFFAGKSYGNLAASCLETMLKGGKEGKRLSHIIMACFVMHRVSETFRTSNWVVGNTHALTISFSYSKTNHLLTIELKHNSNLLRDWDKDKDTVLHTVSGKPTKVMGKLFGERVATHMASHTQLKTKTMQVHYSKHYIPEIYRKLSTTSGMGSCMSKESSEYDLPDFLHPVMAYENSPNAAMVLLYSPDSEEYVARAIVNLDNYHFAKSYGLGGSISMLESSGLVCITDMDGLKLSQIDYEGDRLLPYVDGDTQRCEDRGGMWVVDEEGEYEGNYNTGRESGSNYCSCCEEYTSDELYCTDDDEDVCEGCRDSHYVYVEHGGRDGYYNEQNVVYCDGRNYYLHEDDAKWCDYSESYYLDTDTFYLIETEGRCEYSIHRENLDDCLNEWDNVSKIDGETPREFFGLDEGEEAA